MAQGHGNDLRHVFLFIEYTNPTPQLDLCYGTRPNLYYMCKIRKYSPVFKFFFFIYSACTVEEIQKPTHPTHSLTPLSLCSLFPFLFSPFKIVFCTSGPLTQPTSTSNKAQR